MPQKISSKRQIKKVSSFLGVGVFNTLFNVILFDMLIFLLSMGYLFANFVSLVISISISFFLNKVLVFRDEGNNSGRKYAIFIIGTFIIQLITQHLAVWLLGERYTIIGTTLYNIVHPFIPAVSSQFMTLSTAKIIGVAFSIILSYLFYDRRVFTDQVISEPKPTKDA